ncbi:MAG: dihydrofolate reductase family protein [Acidimicrobiales bacterium]
MRDPLDGVGQGREGALGGGAGGLHGVRIGRFAPELAPTPAQILLWSSLSYGCTYRAEIMGRNKFGPQRGPWEDHDRQGWWGDSPPFHTPVFVLTHHPRPSFTLADTTFHFIEASPGEALRQAQAAADGQDVRLGGGVANVRQFLEADLVDTMHVAVAPAELGRGERLWESPDELLDRFHLETVASPSGVTHHIFWRR